MNKLETATDRTLTIERTLNAPLRLVWEAWSEPKHLANWWGPKGMAIEVLEFDFTVGGKWKFKMPMPNGQEFISEGVYSEIIPMEKIVTSADFKPMTVGVEMHMIFEAKGEQTQFTFHVVHETAEYCKQQEEMGFYNGWGAAFDRLAMHLA
ncbi:MAG: SRPBCC domain-containing protein [Bacteroidota bacterium]